MTEFAEQTLTRRVFLQGAATASGLLAVGAAGCSPRTELVETGDEAAAPFVEDEIFQGVCRGGCVGNCPMNVHVRDGKVVRTSRIAREQDARTRICQRGLSHPQRIYAPYRIQRPMRRVEGTERGAGEWEQLSWDEAIEYICSKWQQIRSESGDASILYTSGGSGDRGMESGYYTRLFALMGSTAVDNCYDQAYLYNQAVLYGSASATGPVLNGHEVMYDAKQLFVWGGNPTEADTVVWVYMKNAIDRGAKLVVVDPNYTIAASKADLWVPLKPGTDAALAMAMINVIVSENLHDVEALQKGSVAPFLVKEDGAFLRLSDLGRAEAGAEDDAPVVISEDGAVGTAQEIDAPSLSVTAPVEGFEVTTAFDLLVERCSEWTLEKASALCDVPADTIVELAHRYAEGPTSVYYGYGPDHFANGFGAYSAVRTLVPVTGQYGKPGAGIVGQNTTMICFPAIGVPEDAVPGPTVAFPRLPDLMKTGKYGDLEIEPKSLFVIQCNPLASQIDRQAMLEAFSKIDFIVTVDVNETDTTRYSDVVLPACHYFERTSLTYFISPSIQLNEKAVEPLYESKSDFDIITLLGKGMGYESYFDASIEDYFEAAFNNPVAEEAGVTWESFKQDKLLDFTDLSWIGAADHIWGTPTGRFEFYLENPQPNHDYGQEFDRKKVSLPYWEQPHEAWDEGETAEAYPFILMTERAKFMAHSTFARNRWLSEIIPEPIVTMNSGDAEQRGITDGDIIRLFNDRGHVVMKVQTSSGVRPGALVMDHGWDGSQFIDGHYSNLTTCAVDPFVCNPYYYDLLCDIELYTEGA